MDSRKQKKLKKMGGRVTTVQEFLKLGDEDVAVIEARLVSRRVLEPFMRRAGSVAKAADLSARRGFSTTEG